MPTLYLYIINYTVNINMDFCAFSHGQIQSKLWLCEILEPYLPKQAKILILASWYNTLGMMMVIRQPKNYQLIVGIEKDFESIKIANNLCDAWMINNDHIIKNENLLIEDYTYWDFNQFDAIINTSVEDISSNSWYIQIPKGKLLALQSNNLTPELVRHYNNWLIKDPNPDITTFKNKYPMENVLFEGEKQFDYGDLKYSRYMLIGKK